jgi:hypothetical protein
VAISIAIDVQLMNDFVGVVLAVVVVVAEAADAVVVASDPSDGALGWVIR